MPEDLEKGNALIVRFFFSESHCKLFLFKFLSHFLICVNTQQPTVLRVYNLQIRTAASVSIAFHLSCLYPITIKTSWTLENKRKFFLKHLKFFCKVFLPPEWWYKYGPVYIEQNSICSLSSRNLAKAARIKAGYEFKAWYSCSWNSCTYKQCYSRGATACCCLKEDGFVLSPLLRSCHWGPPPSLVLCLLWCLYTLPVISLSHQTGRKLSKV